MENVICLRNFPLFIDLTEKKVVGCNGSRRDCLPTSGDIAGFTSSLTVFAPEASEPVQERRGKKESSPTVRRHMCRTAFRRMLLWYWQRLTAQK